MWKTKINGGCKLINVQLKSETSKAKWLMDITTNPNLKVNFDIFSALVGNQKGNNSGKDLIFKSKPHVIRVLEIGSPFYKEALRSISIFERKKGIPNHESWVEENIFYNPLITNSSVKSLRETEYFQKKQFL